MPYFVDWSNVKLFIKPCTYVSYRVRIFVHLHEPETLTGGAL